MRISLTCCLTSVVSAKAQWLNGVFEFVCETMDEYQFSWRAEPLLRMFERTRDQSFIRWLASLKMVELFYADRI